MDTMTHLHASHWREGDPAGCLTVCGRECDTDTAYRGRDHERATCPTCRGELERVGMTRPLYVARSRGE